MYEFIKLIKQVSIDQLNTYHKMKVYCLQKYHEYNDISQLKSMAKSNKLTLQNINYQLKALMGFPKNKKRLDHIRDEFENAYSNAKTYYQELFDKLVVILIDILRVGYKCDAPRIKIMLGTFFTK